MLRFRRFTGGTAAKQEHKGPEQAEHQAHEISKQLDHHGFEPGDTGPCEQRLRQKFAGSKTANRNRERAHDGDQRDIVEIPGHRQVHAHGHAAEVVDENAQRLRHRRKSRDSQPQVDRPEALETPEHVRQSEPDLFGKDTAKDLIKQESQAAAEQRREQHAEPEENPQRGPHEGTLRRIVHKEQQSHRDSEQRNKEEAEQPVEERRRESRAHGILPALHADVVDLLHVAADIARHEVVEEQPDIVQLEQAPIRKSHALLFEQQLPLEASRKVREEHAKNGDDKRQDAFAGK